eukprot:Skav214147  [mRNA]  locus=scaffold1645:228501:231106:- [translate_table: standard]
MAPTDSVHDLQDKILAQLCPERPWAVMGRLLHHTEVLPETLMLKDINFEEAPEVKYLSQQPDLENEMSQMFPRSEVLLLPEVIRQVLDSCKLQAYRPEVQWVLEAVTQISQEEIEQQWKEICEDETMRCKDLRPSQQEARSEPWLQLKKGHRGACRKQFYLMTSKFQNGVLNFTYSIFNDGSYVPVTDPPRGWYARNSASDEDGRHSAPLLAPRRNVAAVNPRVSCFETSSQQLALPCAILALKSEEFEVMEVLAADRLHGFGLRAGFDLILAVKSGKTLKTSLIGVYFHPLMTSGAFNIDDMDKFSHQYFDGRIFDDLLDAAVCEHIHHVLVMWHIDLVQTLRWFFTPIPSAFRSFRRQLAKQWFPDSDLRIENFNKLLHQQLLVHNGLEPLLLELPKTVCANPSCPAGFDCAKHQHLFEIPVAPTCPGEEKCPRKMKRPRPCRWHHCKAQAQQGPRPPGPCHCVQLWVPTALGIPWSAPKAKAAKPKGKKQEKTVTCLQKGWPQTFIKVLLKVGITR